MPCGERQQEDGRAGGQAGLAEWTLHSPRPQGRVLVLGGLNSWSAAVREGRRWGPGFGSLGASLLLHLSSFLFPLPPISEETVVLGGRVRNSSTAQAAQVSVSPSTQWAGGSEGTSSSEALQGLNMPAPLGMSWPQGCSRGLFQGAGQRDGGGIPAAWGLGRDAGPVLPRLGGALGTSGQEVPASLHHVWDKVLQWLGAAQLLASDMGSCNTEPQATVLGHRWPHDPGPANHYQPWEFCWQLSSLRLPH